jgi:hypothetical protein
MATRIWKYGLNITDVQVLKLPRDHELLTIQVQDNNVVLWAAVDPDEPADEEVPIYCYGTGQAGPSADQTYIATIQHLRCVWHFYF